MTHKKWYQRPLYPTLIFCVAFIGAANIFPALAPVLKTFIAYIKMIWWVTLLGIFISGVIDALVPTRYITAYLSTSRSSSIYYAALLGFLMSACSHGILAIAMQLFKKGASTASVITFLLASPWANLSITLLLFAFFGFKALCFTLSALFIAITTGVFYQRLERYGFVEKNPTNSSAEASFSIKHDIQKRWRNFSWSSATGLELGKDILKGSWHMAHMVLWWVIIGALIGSLIEAYIPPHFFQRYLDSSFTGLLATLAIASVIEVCSEGSSPIAFSIYKQTQAFGNAFIFLMAGVITDITELGLIWHNIGKKAALWLPLITLPQALLLAYLFNIFL